MQQLQMPKAVGITFALAFALLIGGALWMKFNPAGISERFQAQDAARMQREEGENPERLKDGAGPKTPQEEAAVKFHSDKAYQPESGHR